MHCTTSLEISPLGRAHYGKSLIMNGGKGDCQQIKQEECPGSQTVNTDVTHQSIASVLCNVFL